jgi:HEAT repeat protein
MAAQTEASTAADTKEDEDRVQIRVAELLELSRKLDHKSTETLLAEVRNEHPEIRHAALDAISQSGNRTLIPRLLQAAEEVEDAEQRREITETVEFLKLPTLSEVMSGTNNP